MFSPGNLRATFDNAAYERLLSHYIGEKYTLRYTGGMVPDVFQIIVKEKGVFTNVSSPSTKAKLRILFEVAPLALLVRAPPFVWLHMVAALSGCCFCAAADVCERSSTLQPTPSCLAAASVCLSHLAPSAD